MQLQKTINEERLFNLLPYFFDHPSSVLVEIAQNAVRSGATMLDIALKDGVLKTIDNGSGADNPESLFVLADSNWPEEVEENQKPAGWGLFFLYSISEEVVFTSRFGTVKVDCKRYLADHEYRLCVLEGMNPDMRFDGFAIEARLRPEVRDKVLDQELLQWFPLDIIINGTRLPRKKAEEQFGDYGIKTVYEGNPVYIKLDCSFYNVPEKLAREMFVVWYGIPINNNLRLRPSVVMDVVNGSPVTPVLPYRRTVKHDGKLDAFWQFVRDTVVRESMSVINDLKKEISFHDLEKRMKVMGALGTQDELNSLDRFYVEVYEPHHDGFYGSGRGHEIRMIGRGDPLPVNEELVLEGLEAYEFDKEGVFLPEGAVTSVNLPERRPEWLKTLSRKRAVRVVPDAESKYCGRLTWFKADIDSDTDIKAVAVAQDYCDGYVFYADTPEDVYGVSDVVFDNRVYSEDGDQWDSQKYDFDEEIRKDIMAITGTYRIYDLLDGLSIAGVSPHEVVSIDICERIMTLKTKKGVKTLNIA